MKKLLMLFAVSFSLMACEKQQTQTTSSSKISDAEIDAMTEKMVDSVAAAIDHQASLETVSKNPQVGEAMKLIDESTDWMKKSIRKEVSVESANKHINPLMDQFNKLNSSLSPAEQEEVKNYRISKAQEAIDLQIKYSK